MTQSRRFEVGSLLFAALQAAPALAGAKFKRNPVNPFPLSEGTRVVFFEEQFDGFVDGKGQQPLRRYRFLVGVINRTEPDAEAAADADALVALDTLTQRANALVRTHDAAPLRELQTEFKVEGVDVGGALNLTTFEIEYRRAKPPRT